MSISIENLTVEQQRGLFSGLGDLLVKHGANLVQDWLSSGRDISPSAPVSSEEQRSLFGGIAKLVLQHAPDIIGALSREATPSAASTSYCFT